MLEITLKYIFGFLMVTVLVVMTARYRMGQPAKASDAYIVGAIILLYISLT